MKKIKFQLIGVIFCMGTLLTSCAVSKTAMKPTRQSSSGEIMQSGGGAAGSAGTAGSRSQTNSGPVKKR